MNNEPVAWINEDNFLLGDVLNSAVYRTKPNEEFTIPLYTHPADLTDEEIMEIAKNCGWETGDSWDDCVCCSKFCLESFARAILRKAQEK